MENEWRSRLKEMIDADGRSLRAISKAAGFGENYVQQMLKDKKQPTFPKLARVLGVLGSVATLYVTTGLRLTPEAERFLRLALGLDEKSQKDVRDALAALEDKTSGPESGRDPHDQDAPTCPTT